MTKGKAFSLCLAAIMTIFFTLVFVVLFKDKAIELIPVGPVLGALCGLIAAYIGGNVADNKVKGDSWNQDMYNSLNNTEGKK